MGTEEVFATQSSVLIPQSLEVRRILLVKPSSFGDVLHALPTAGALRRRFPDARLAWLVDEEWADAVRGVPAVDEVILSGRRRWLRAVAAGRGAGAALGEFGALLRALRAARYDLAVDLQGLFKSAVFVAAAGARVRVGLSTAREGSRHTCTHIVAVPAGEHAVERYLRVARALGAPEGPREFPVVVPAAAEQEADGLLAPMAAPLAVLHPAARWPTKLWTPEAFAAVGDALADGLGARVAITGGGADVDAAEAVAARMGRPALNLAGRTSLKVLAAILRRAAVMVTVDSGPMHLAAALGTPLVGLFGPTSPARTGPYGPGPRRILQEGLPCVPCLSRRCGVPDERLCMQSLDAQRVAAEAMAIARPPAPGPAAPGDRDGCTRL
jgi:lipopolysaccharide heptosyltransferase I